MTSKLFNVFASHTYIEKQVLYSIFYLLNSSIVMHTLFQLILSIIAILPLISSCTTIDKDHRKVVEEWMGKEITIPANLKYQIGGDFIDYDFFNADFKIVTYVDSDGCTSCKMKLKSWDKLINELKSSPDITINFLMVINTDEKAVVETLLKQNNFNHPVAIDSKGDYYDMNVLPEKVDYQTFLLDGNDRVVALGNPVYNPKIKELYARLIFDSLNGGKTLGDDEEQICKNPVRGIGVVSKGDTITKHFRFLNDTESDLTLQDVIPSCHCVSAKVDWKVLKSGEYADVEISYVADTIPQQFRRYADVWFKERPNPERLVIHGFIK